jgi:ABC-type oligopeptide transport system ATPase subunit
MVTKAKLTTVQNNSLNVKKYGEKSFQSDKDGTIYVPEYSFEAIEYILDEIEKARQKNWDRTILLTGEEGCGKSTLGAHLATRLGMQDETEVCYAPKQFLERLRDAKKGEVVWLDEGARGLYSRDAMTKVNKQLTKAFTQIRIKELVSIICLPHKQLLDKNMRNRRIHYWGDVRSREYSRGFVKWRISGKKDRAVGENRIPKHQNEWDISVYWEPLFYMRFPQFKGYNGFDWDKYEQVKEKALDEFLDEANATDKPTKVVPNLAAVLQYLRETKDYEVSQLADASGLSQPSVYRYLKKDTPEDWSLPEKEDN